MYIHTCILIQCMYIYTTVVHACITCACSMHAYVFTYTFKMTSGINSVGAGLQIRYYTILLTYIVADHVSYINIGTKAE